MTGHDLGYIFRTILPTMLMLTVVAAAPAAAAVPEAVPPAVAHRALLRLAPHPQLEVGHGVVGVAPEVARPGGNPPGDLWGWSESPSRGSTG